MLDRINDALAVHPKYVIIAGGVNDLNAFVPASIIESNIATMCQRVQSQHAAPVLCTVTPEFLFHKDPAKLNEWITNYARSNGYPLIDFYSVVNSNRTYLSSDGIHPSSAGYTAMANAATKVLTANETVTKRR
jgi:lysophospholipase L1-like esterase